MLPSQTEAEIFHKAESLQMTGSFKIRPALNQLLTLSPEDRNRGVVTSSSGNFAQGVAYAAHILGISAKIVMMRSSNPLKVERTRRWGGTVVFCGNRFEARAEKVREIERGEDRTSIHPFDHVHAIEGNATLGLEIVEQLPDLEQVVVPISGGGLISGVAFAVKSIRPAARVIGVQPQGSNATFRSFREGKAVSIEKADTLADGLTVTRPGKLTFPLIRHWVDDVVTVSEESIRRAVRHYLIEEKLVVEPSGAVPLAALLEGKIERRKTVVVISGGNLDPSLGAALLEEEMPAPDETAS